MAKLQQWGVGRTEALLLLVILVMAVGLSLATPTFLTLSNLFDLLNFSSVNIIFGVGLMVVLVAGGIDISFAVGASVTQYLTALAVMQFGGGNWLLGFAFAMLFGALLGAINAGLIYYFRIVSIVVTISTFNVFFGGLMFFTGGVSLYDLPDWWLESHGLVLETSHGVATLGLPVPVMVGTVIATWLLLRRTSYGRQVFAMGNNAEAARRLGISMAGMHFLAFCWLGMMSGIAGLMQAHYVKEVVPNALNGRELDVLAAVVLGGVRLGGGRGTIFGVILGILLVAITGNGLNLLGISSYAYKMIIGAIILIAITVSSQGFGNLVRRTMAPRHTGATP